MRYAARRQWQRRQEHEHKNRDREALLAEDNVQLAEGLGRVRLKPLLEAIAERLRFSLPLSHPEAPLVERVKPTDQLGAVLDERFRVKDRVRVDTEILCLDETAKLDALVPRLLSESLRCSIGVVTA